MQFRSRTGLMVWFIKEPPSSWDIFWDPKYKGKYSVTKAVDEANIFMTALSLGIEEKNITSFQSMNNDNFRQKLRKLLKNADSFWPSFDEPPHLKGLYFASSWAWSLPGLRKLGEN